MQYLILLSFLLFLEPAVAMEQEDMQVEKLIDETRLSLQKDARFLRKLYKAPPSSQERQKVIEYFSSSENPFIKMNLVSFLNKNQERDFKKEDEDHFIKERLLNRLQAGDLNERAYLKNLETAYNTSLMLKKLN